MVLIKPDGLKMGTPLLCRLFTTGKSDSVEHHGQNDLGVIFGGNVAYHFIADFRIAKS